MEGTLISTYPLQNMERSRMIGSVDNFDGQQNLEEWIQMVGRAAEFAGWTEEATFKAAMFRLRGDAGEHAEQLKAEGKIKTWKELQMALKDRFETAGKEQWYQYLLNTGTQGSKTVQEWAQTVRKLALRAIGSEDQDLKQEGQPQQNEGEEREREMQRKEARKNLLDYMRRTNFVRGLRSNLRQEVWRKKCKTFDEAVKAAAEEEVVEASHREEEVLSCYKRDAPQLATENLIDRIVAALEVREGGKEGKPKESNGKEEREPKAYRSRQSRPERAPLSDDESEEEEGDSDRRWRRRAVPSSRPGASQSINRNEHHYGDQIPLPRPIRTGPGMQGPRQWQRVEPRNGGRGSSYDSFAQKERDRAQNLCYNCHRPGHLARDCYTISRPQQGNGARRLR